MDLSADPPRVGCLFQAKEDDEKRNSVPALWPGRANDTYCYEEAMVSRRIYDGYVTWKRKKQRVLPYSNISPHQVSLPRGVDLSPLATWRQQSAAVVVVMVVVVVQLQGCPPLTSLRCVLEPRLGMFATIWKHQMFRDFDELTTTIDLDFLSCLIPLLLYS